MTIEESIRVLRNETANRMKEKWSDEQRALLEEMFRNGTGISKMAVFFGRSEIAIINQIYLMGLFQRVYEPREREPKCKCPKCAYYAECRKDGCARCAIHKEYYTINEQIQDLTKRDRQRRRPE